MTQPDTPAPCPFCGSDGKHVERHNPMSKWRHSIDCGGTTCGASGPVEATKHEAIAAWNRRTTPAGDAVERAVMVCPQCEGEGGYPDGLDADACHTECTRCGGNGWIVDRAAIAAMPGVGWVSSEVLAFLRGEGPLDGCYFGDKHPTERGAFWWRKHLPPAPAKE